MPLPPLNDMQNDVVQQFTNTEQLVIESPTGSGKTYAYLASILDTIDLQEGHLQAVILVPTKDLVMQVSRVLDECAIEGFHHLAFPGHTNMTRQIEQLKKGKPHVLISQPERLHKLIEARKIKPHTIQIVIFDEADTMICDQLRNLEPVMKRLPRDAKKGYFSATYSTSTFLWIEKYGTHTHKLYEDNAGEKSYETVTVSSIKMGETLADELKKRQPKKCLIFCNKAGTIGDIRYELEKRGIYPAGLDRNTKNEERKIILQDFAQDMEWPDEGPHPNILISTDTLTRGIDFKDVELVVNWRLPFDHTHFIHRSGRTGRYGNTGTVLSLLIEKEVKTYEEWAMLKT